MPAAAAARWTGAVAGAEDTSMLIRGKCHCGNISFALDWEPDPAEIRARACGCSFCRKHGGVWTSHPRGRLRIAVAEPQGLNRYAFGTGTAEFLVCTRCGCVPVVTSLIDGRIYAVVSVNAFEHVDAAIIRRSEADFDGEGTADRLTRRKRNWIADVSFEPPAGTG
jgi:hypothetical protein